MTRMLGFVLSKKKKYISYKEKTENKRLLK